MDAFTPVLYGSKLNAPKKKAAPAPDALRGVPPGKAAPPPTYNLANLLVQRSALQSKYDQERSQSDYRPGPSVSRNKLRILDEQIAAASAPARTAPAAKLPVTAPVVAATPAPAPAPAVVPVAAASPVEQQATTLKLAEEERQRQVEKAKADELARQDDIRRRRGYGVSSFVTGGLRGLPTNLAQLLGV